METIMDAIQQELGRCLTPAEVAEYLHIAERTVKENCSALGGVRISAKTYLFFEKRLIDAISKQTEEQRQVPMGRANTSQRQEEEKALRDKEGCNRMGSGRERKNTHRGSGRENDPYGLAA